MHGRGEGGGRAGGSKAEGRRDGEDSGGGGRRRNWPVSPSPTFTCSFLGCSAIQRDPTGAHARSVEVQNLTRGAMRPRVSRKGMEISVVSVWKGPAKSGSFHPEKLPIEVSMLISTRQPVNRQRRLRLSKAGGPAGRRTRPLGRKLSRRGSRQ